MSGEEVTSKTLEEQVVSLELQIADAKRQVEEYKVEYEGAYTALERAGLANPVTSTGEPEPLTDLIDELADFRTEAVKQRESVALQLGQMRECLVRAHDRLVKHQTRLDTGTLLRNTEPCAVHEMGLLLAVADDLKQALATPALAIYARHTAMREALEFYSNPDSWECPVVRIPMGGWTSITSGSSRAQRDNGDRARNALSGSEEQQR